MPHSLTVRPARKAPRRRLYYALACCLLLFALAACGNRGPLYLPGERAPAAAVPAQAPSETDEEREKKAQQGDEDPPGDSGGAPAGAA